MLYLADVHELARTLTLRQLRVMLALTRQMAYNGPFRYSTNRVAAELDMHQTNVSREVTWLKDNGFILWVGPERNRVYLNPRYFWHGNRRGRVAARMDLQRQYPEATYLPQLTEAEIADIEQHPDLPDQEPTPEEDR
jgi:hypothetical protein